MLVPGRGIFGWWPARFEHDHHRGVGSAANPYLTGHDEKVPRNYSKLPLDARLDMARMIGGGGGLGFRVCKLWADPRWAPNAAGMLSS